jgi:hypothetical protein
MSEAWETMLASLPPLERRELQSLQARTAPLFAGVAVDEASSSSKMLAQRTCTVIPSQLPSQSPLVSAWLALMQDYQDKRYGAAKSAVQARCQVDTTTTKDGKDANVVLRTYAETIDAHKNRTGYWAGEWILADDEASLAGSLSVHVYYYEEANLQLRAQRQAPSTPISSAADAMKVIKLAEAGLLSDLTDQDAMQTSLKKIRRILPITKTRMKWDNAAQNAVRLLNARSTGK